MHYWTRHGSVATVWFSTIYTQEVKTARKGCADIYVVVKYSANEIIRHFNWTNQRGRCREFRSGCSVNPPECLKRKNTCRLHSCSLCRFQVPATKFLPRYRCNPKNLGRGKKLGCKPWPRNSNCKNKFLAANYLANFLNPLSRIQAKIRPHFLIWSLSRPLAFLQVFSSYAALK